MSSRCRMEIGSIRFKAWSVLVGLLFASSVQAQPRYTIVDLTELAEPLGVLQCEGTAINEAGQVVGFEVLPEYRTQAIFWDSDGTPALLGMLPEDNSTWTHALNNGGLIAGVSQYVWWEMVGHQIRIYEENKASIWRDGAVTDISTLVTGGDPLDLDRAWGVNDDGLIVGFARPPGSTTGGRGFLFEDGFVTDLGDLDTDLPADHPIAINSHRQIAGYGGFGQDKAFLWEDGVLINLHEHASIGGVTSRAWDINEAGQIVGEAQFLISHPESPALWEDREPVNLVGHLFGRPQGAAFAINSHNQIVGWVNDLDDLTDDSRAFILDNGEYHDLIDLIPPDLGWDQLLVPWDINDRGQIVGGAMRFGELGHGFLLTPIVAGDIDGDGDVDLADLATLLAAYDTCEGDPGYDPAADLDGSGCVELADLATLLAHYGTGL